MTGVLILSLVLTEVIAVLGLREDIRPPVFTSEPPRNVEFSNSTGALIPCSAEGKPIPTVSWTKHDGSQIQDIPNIRVMRHDGSLFFHSFSGDSYRADVHASIYRCIATNAAGSLGSRSVHVRAVVLQRYEIRLFDEFVLRGNTAVLRCPVPSFVSDYVHVTAWEKADGFLITPSVVSGKYGMLENGDLYIRDTTEKDSVHGFRCHTEDRVTKEKKSSRNMAKVIVTEPHHRQPPKIFRQMGRVVARAGHRVTLSCVAQGYPVPSYRWQKTVEDHITSLSLSSSARQEDGVLVIPEVSRQDAGKYICIASNAVGEEKIEIELIIEVPVAVTIYPIEIRSDVSKTVTFNCSVSGGRTGSIIWRKDMTVLSQSSRILFRTPTALQIRSLTRSDAGIYQCFVTTEWQSEQASGMLIIGDLAPQLKVTFSEQTVAPGSYVSLSCVSSGNPTPQIEWILDGMWQLSSRHGVMVSSYLLPHGDVIGYLNITSADVADSGLYSCKSVNDAGYDVHSRRLNVYGPLVVRPLENITVLAGDDFEVVCPFGGYPFDEIRWKKDGRVLPNNQRQKVYTNGSLIIKDIEPNPDEGSYTCEVTYSKSTPSSRTFNVKVRARPRVSPFSFQRYLHEGMRTAVTCIVVSGDPPISIRWTKDGLPFLNGMLGATVLNQEAEYISTLLINSLQYKHNGNYSCIVSNEFASSEYSAVLAVRVPPRWLLEPRDVTAVSGSPTRIDCQADGVPQPHIRWKVATPNTADEFRTIISSSHVHILVNGSLNFRGVEASDEGNYLCEASNGVGVGLSTVVKLTVRVPPRFQPKFLAITTMRGQRAVIDCIPGGDKSMVFTWRKNGELLQQSLDPRYSQQVEKWEDTNRAKLIISKAERKDSALFTCSARNDFGEDTLSVQLTVQGITSEPIRAWNHMLRYFCLGSQPHSLLLYMCCAALVESLSDSPDKPVTTNLITHRAWQCISLKQRMDKH